MLERVQKEPCKKVTTMDRGGQPNGFLVELYKEGDKTSLYLTATYPKGFKGYHLHTVRSGHLVCVRGRMKITIVEGIRKVEHILSGDRPERLRVPTGVWVGYENVGEEEGWILNFPSPAYDPTRKGEQQEMTREEIAQQLRGA